MSISRPPSERPLTYCTVLSILVLLLPSTALTEDFQFKTASVTSNRPPIHGPFNVSKLTIQNLGAAHDLILHPEGLGGRASLAHRLEGDDLLSTPPAASHAARRPPSQMSAVGVGEENAIVASADLSKIKLLPSSWEVDGATGLQALDLQIGVSHTSILLSSVHNIGVFTKDGAVQSHMSLADFFQLVMQDMNNSVLDPATGQKFVDPYKINEFYDARILFDSYRKRFWVGCLARNWEAKYGTEPDHTAHRVTKFALAVSKTENPQDGFISYWWDDAYDYPNMGVSEKLVIVGLQGEVMVAVADDLASGTATKPYQLKNFHHADNGVAGEKLIALLHHGTSTGNAHFLVSNYADTLGIWAVDQTNPAKVALAEVPVYAYQGPTLADQESNADVPHPHQVQMTNVGTLVMKAVYRDGKIYAVWHDARQWNGAAGPVTSIRLVRVDVSHYPDYIAGAGKIDRTFGKRNVTDPANTVFSYYWPSLDVNRDGTMIISYSRSGKTIFPEIRYSIYRAKDPDIESSQLFQGGQYPLGGEDSSYTTRPDTAPVGRLDFTASAVDPADDRTIWILQPYAIKASAGNGGYRLKVGRILVQP